MAVKEATVLIFDTQHGDNDWRIINEQFDVVDIEKNHEHGLNTIKKTKPNIVAKVIHDNEPYTFHDTLLFLKTVKEISKDIQVLVINPENEKKVIYQLIDIGVDGVCDINATSLDEAFRYMKEYSIYISFSYQRVLLEEFRTSPEQKPTAEIMLQVNRQKAKEELTNREIEVLEDLIMNTGNSDDRAQRLFISPKTYKNHIARMMDKLEADNRTHIIPTAIRKGIIETVVH